MGTRASFGYKHNDDSGSVTWFYVGYDGYLSGLGMDLLEYDTLEKVINYISDLDDSILRFAEVTDSIEDVGTSDSEFDYQFFDGTWHVRQNCAWNNSPKGIWQKLTKRLIQLSESPEFDTLEHCIESVRAYPYYIFRLPVEFIDKSVVEIADAVCPGELRGDLKYKGEANYTPSEAAVNKFLSQLETASGGE